jgi:putative membrane protein
MGLTHTVDRTPPPGADAAPASARAATPLLVAHAALIAFSTWALCTFLAGPPPAWLQTPTNQAVLRFAWAYSGPTYVTLGALAALCHASGRFGWPRALSLFAVAYALSLGAELLGTGTGYPFGPYSYTPLLGYLVGGRVPFPIPLSWFFMVYCSLAIVGRLVPVRVGLSNKLLWAVLSGAVLTAWDVSMDPAMTAATHHWIWHVKGAFYGMPYSNWFGWWLTGSVIAFAMTSIVPRAAIADRVSPSRFPLVLYAVNGVMPIALCVRDGMWWAVLWGALAMLVPLALAAARGPMPAAAAAARWSGADGDDSVTGAAAERVNSPVGGPPRAATEAGGAVGGGRRPRAAQS